MSDVLRYQVPPQAPGPLKRIVATIVGVGLGLGALAYGFGQIPPVHDNMIAAGRSLHVCAPKPPVDIQPFQSEWLGSGSTYSSAVGPTLTKLRQENPDYNIDFVEGREFTEKSWGTPHYRYEGTFRVTPKWTSSFC